MPPTPHERLCESPNMPAEIRYTEQQSLLFAHGESTTVLYAERIQYSHAPDSFTDLRAKIIVYYAQPRVYGLAPPHTLYCSLMDPWSRADGQA